MSKRIMKDSGIEWIGEIPENWETSSYGKILKRYRAFDDNPNKQVLSLTIQGVKERNTSVSYGKMAEDYTKHQLVKNGQLIFTPRDFDCTPILSGIAPCDGCISNLYFVLDSKGFVDLNFINYQMWGVKWGGDIWRQLSYGMRFSFNFSQFSALKLAIPPLHEQQSIATYLDEQVSRLDQLIQDQQQVIEDWKAYKQSLITETVTKGLEPEVEMKDSGIEWIGEIPSHWRVKKSKYLINFRTGLSITKKDFVELGYKTINYGQIHSKYTFDLDLTRDDLFKINFDYAQLNPSTILKEGDFVFCDTSEDLNGCGNCVLVENTNKEVLLAGSHTTIGKLKGDSVPRYMAYLFKSDKFREQIRSNVVGTKVFSITQRILKNTFLIIPPLHEQQQIADFLDEKCLKIDQLIEDKQRLIEDLKAYKQSLIYECVTGKKEIV